jgi:hypothetical protein
MTLAGEANAARWHAGFQAGLPAERRQRRLKVYWSTDVDDVTAQIPCDKSPHRGLSPAVPREESGRVLRHWRVWGALQSRGVTGGGEGVVEASPRVPAGSHAVSGAPPEDPAGFCRRIQRVIGIDVYQNSTVD